MFILHATIFSYFSQLVLDSISKIEAETKTISNAAGVETQVGESWTDKIMGMKGQGQLPQSEELSKTEGDGADDDEWVCGWPRMSLCFIQQEI